MKNAVNIVLAAAMVAVLLLAGTSTYSAYVSSTSHKNSCARADLILNTFHDVIELAFKPTAGQTLSARCRGVAAALRRCARDNRCRPRGVADSLVRGGPGEVVVTSTAPNRPLTVAQIDKQLAVYVRQLARGLPASVSREECLLSIDALLDQRLDLTDRPA